MHQDGLAAKFMLLLYDDASGVGPVVQIIKLLDVRHLLIT